MLWFFRVAYGSLAVALLVHPHLIRGHVLFLSEAYAESLATLVIFALLYGTYRLHRWEIARQLTRNSHLRERLSASESKLLDAFRYLGLVNRRLPLLQNLSSDLLAAVRLNRNGRKGIFHRLLTTAVISIVHREWGVLRFVETTTLRTVREFAYGRGAGSSQPLPNRWLVNGDRRPRGGTPAKGLAVVATSDRHMPVRGYLVYPTGPNPADIRDGLPVLQAIVDQAQLFYKYLYS